jgi:hemerythrin
MEKIIKYLLPKTHIHYSKENAIMEKYKEGHLLF